MRRVFGSSDDGQILAIFAGGLVALLAVCALVIDLGFVFLLRRQEQNAADPGAVAAARYIRPTVNQSNMWRAACTYAVLNDFNPRRTDNGQPCDTSDVADGSSITVNYPPSRSGGEYAGRPGYVEVIISKPHSSFFASIVGLPQIQVASSAVAAFDEGTAGSSSLVALSEKGCGGGAAAQINGGGGGGGIRIFPADGVTDPGGYIQVNSTCGVAAGGDNQCTGGSSGSFVMNGGTTVEAPGLYTGGACITNGGEPPAIDLVDEAASYVGDPLSLVRPPHPSDLPTRTCPTANNPNQNGTPSNPRTCGIGNNQTVTFQPGTYYGGWSIGNGATITLQPGIYVLAGGGISQTGGTLTSATGRVLIYSTDAPLFRATCLAGGGNAAQCQGDIDLNGSGRLSLLGLARDSGCPPYGASTCPYGGLLLWQDGSGSGAGRGRADVDLGGGASFELSGTIYTSGGHVGLAGNGISSGCTSTLVDRNCAAVQIIADTFSVSGSAVLDMPYDPNGLYQLNLKGLVK